MKVLKYVIAFFIIVPIIFLIGESTFYYATQTLSRSSLECTLAIDSATNDKDDIDDFVNALESIRAQNSVIPFVLEFSYPSYDDTIVYIYCSDNDKSQIESFLSLNSSYKSLLYGNMEISYKPLEEISLLNNLTDIHLIGADSECSNALALLSDDYEIGVVTEAADDGMSPSYIYFALVFSCAVILVISVFDVESRKKAMVINTIFGNRKSVIILRESLIDLMIYILMIGASVFACAFLNNILDSLSLIFYFTLAIAVFNFIPYISVLVCNYSKIIKGGNSQISALVLANAINVAVIVLLVISVSSAYYTISENSGYIKAEELFDNEEYSFCDFSMLLNDSDLAEKHDKYKEYNEEIYRSYYDECEPIMLKGMYIGDDIDYDEVDDNAIYANSNAAEYICSWIDELDISDLDSDFTIIYTSEYSKSYIEEKAAEFIKNTEFFDSNAEGETAADFSCKTICLDGDYKVIALNSSNSNLFEQLDNPIIIINNVPANELLQPIEQANRANIYNTIMYKSSDEFLDGIQSAYSFDQVVVTNCRNHFYYYWTINKITIIFLVCFSVILMITELLLIIFIVRNYFEINGKEICLEIIHGYTRLQRYFDICFRFLVYTVFGAAAGLAVILYYNSSLWQAAVIISAALFVINILVILFYTSRIERKNFNQIIKGGAL